MNRFTVHDTPLAGLKIVERLRLTDPRGFLSRLFCAEEFAVFGWTAPVVQMNHSSTKYRGTVRGMHFQYPPHSDMKLVCCLQGEIWDVAVDIRASSPTFLQWFGLNLSAENSLALLIPEGFAHGFQSLADNIHMIYCHSRGYNAGSEGGLQPLDPLLKITWPLPITSISERDKSHSLIQGGFEGVRI